MKGTVKWFNEAKGFGFIVPADRSEDIFVHFSEIQGSGFKTLGEGVSVEFEISEGDKGKVATYVRYYSPNISPPPPLDPVVKQAIDTIDRITSEPEMEDQDEEQKQATDDTNEIEEDQE